MFSIRQNGKPICTAALAFISRTELHFDSVTSKVLSLAFFVFSLALSLCTCVHICLCEGKFKVSLQFTGFTVILFSLLSVNKQNLTKGKCAVKLSQTMNFLFILTWFFRGAVHGNLHQDYLLDLLASSHKTYVFFLAFCRKSNSKFCVHFCASLTSHFLALFHVL